MKTKYYNEKEKMKKEKKAKTNVRQKLEGTPEN